MPGMSILTVLALLCIVFVLAWRFQDTVLGILPFVLCSMGLLLYILAFFRRLSCIDWILLVGGILALCVLVRAIRRHGVGAFLTELRRQLCDGHLWVCVAVLLVMCLLLRGEQLLEWDGLNFWGPDTKSLFFQDGFAPKHSNAASNFGDYTPMAQLLFWWFPHLAGTYNEQYIFFGYYIFGALLLFSIADRFRVEQGIGRVLVPVAACVCAVVLPGVACTAWFRAIYVDPLMAMLFGAALSLIVCRRGAHPVLWKGKLFVLLTCLTLVKSIGVLWAILALGFFCLWWWKERREYRFTLACAGGIAACYVSWSVFCSVMERATYLTTGFSAVAAERLAELRGGVFLSTGNNWGYITSYARAFLLTPIHREATFAIDLTPAMLLVLLFAGAAALWKFGFVPRRKFRRLLLFMVLTIVINYAVLLIGQMTMFYDEVQYLDPVNAVTLMTRYCAPANMGLLILLCSFASGRAAEDGQRVRLPARRGIVASVLTAAILFSCGAYAEMWRRFIYDPLDESRIEKRLQFTALYGDFLDAVQAVPWDEAQSRVLLCIFGQEMNPIVTNAAAPVSFLTLTLSGDVEADLSAISNARAVGHERYLYVSDCTERLAEALSACTADGEAFARNVLYEILPGEDLRLVRVTA